MDRTNDRRIIINEADFGGRQELLKWLGAELSFENYSGASLDALYDRLTDIFEPLTIEIIPKAKAGCSSWLHELCRVLNFAAEERKNITVKCSHRDEE